MKDNLIILATCAPCTNEVMLWNSFIAANKEKFNILFFTEFEYELDIPTVIKIDNLFFYMDTDEIDNALSSTISSIAECEKIWETYDPVASMERAYSWFHYCKFIIKLFKPAAVYVWNGYHLPARAMTRAADELGIEKYVMERGPFANTFVCDKSGINHDSSFIKTYDTIDNVPDDNAIRKFARLYFKSGISNWEQPDASAEKEEFYKKYNIAKDKILIFFPLQIDNDTNAKVFSPHYKSVFEAYRATVDAINDFQDKIFLLVKKHPRQKDITLFAKTPIFSGVLVEDAHIFDCIRYADAIISINSSSAIEAALLGKPVLLLGNTILSANRKIISIQKPEDLQSKIKQLIDMADGSNDLVDTVFFSKLLFHYLFTTVTVYQDIGIYPVEKIPTPESRHFNDKVFFTPKEAILIAKALSNFNQCLKNDSNMDRVRKQLAECEFRLAENERLQTENIKLLKQKDQQIDEIYNSYSWRITKLLRAARNLFYAKRNKEGGNA